MDQARRDAHLAQLEGMGFRPARGLPLERTAGGRGGLRPAREIAMRLCAIDAVFTWVVYDEKDTPAERLRAYVERSKLADAFTPSELALWNKRRSAVTAARHTIGWRLENVWPLAWVLGFDTRPVVSGDMIDDAIVSVIVRQFLPPLAEGVDDLLARARPRARDEVEALEDLFYCAHNAARAIQLGQAPAPRGFDPRAGGGVIHERRHALTWCVSPGVAWDDTDLST